MDTPSSLSLPSTSSFNTDANKDGEDKAEPEEWGEFLHQPGVKYTDFNLIRDEIVRDTEAKTGKNAGKDLKRKKSAPWLSRMIVSCRYRFFLFFISFPSRV